MIMIMKGSIICTCICYMCHCTYVYVIMHIIFFLFGPVNDSRLKTRKFLELLGI